MSTEQPVEHCSYPLYRPRLAGRDKGPGAA
jgi:hypothetical protein